MEALNTRGAAYGDTNQHNKAIADFTAAIELHSEGNEAKTASFFANRARALGAQGKTDKALADLNEAIRLDPKRPLFFLMRSECHQRIGSNLLAALKDADEGVRLDPKNPLAFGRRGSVRYAREEWTEAGKDFDEAVRLDPNLASAFADRAAFLIWCSDEKRRDAPQAFKDATRACELTEWKDPKVLEIYAASIASLGDFESAVKWQKKAMEDAGYMKVAGADARKRLAWYESQTPAGKSAPKKD